MANYLGIEIGGTKLQLGIGDGTSPNLFALERHEIHATRGAMGILESIQSAADDLINRYQPAAFGIGFGGPVNGETGVVLKSHQVDGWEAFPLAQWIADQFGLPAQIGNDCDCAALAESRFGAGRSHQNMAYVTVGTGIGGGLILGKRLHGVGRPAVAEIGHLRPGPAADDSRCTIESVASGWGIAAVANALATCSLSDSVHSSSLDVWTQWLFQLADQSGSMVPQPAAANSANVHSASRPWIAPPNSDEAVWKTAAREWRDRFGTTMSLTAKDVADEAAKSHPIAQFTLQMAASVLGWGIAQLITLTAVECVVVGGGVSLMPRKLFFEPLQTAVEAYVFGPLVGSYEIVPAALGEEVVVHGALALASSKE